MKPTYTKTKYTDEVAKVAMAKNIEDRLLNSPITSCTFFVMLSVNTIDVVLTPVGKEFTIAEEQALKREMEKIFNFSNYPIPKKATEWRYPEYTWIDVFRERDGVQTTRREVQSPFKGNKLIHALTIIIERTQLNPHCKVIAKKRMVTEYELDCGGGPTESPQKQTRE